MSYTSADLIDAIERKAFIPTGQTTFTSTELLAIADEKMVDTIIPSITAVREEYFVYHTDYAVTANRSTYDIPARATAMIAREVALVDGTSVSLLPRIEPEQAVSTATGTPNSFYIKHNQVVLYPTPSATAKTLRIFFFLSPSKLVAVSAAAVIASIDSATQITVTSIPSSWATGNVFDLIRYDGGQEPIVVDQTSTLVSGTAITFQSLPSTLRVGDYVALAGETPLVHLPNNYRPILAQAVAADILESQNQPGAEKAARTLEKQLIAAQRQIAPRTQGNSRVIVGSNWT